MTHPGRPTQHSSKKTPTGREHLLQEENTFYRKRTPSMPQTEHPCGRFYETHYYEAETKTKNKQEKITACK
jgi:hypothetical protein